jgi:hypothetical protein
MRAFTDSALSVKSALLSLLAPEFAIVVQPYPDARRGAGILYKVAKQITHSSTVT